MSLATLVGRHGWSLLNGELLVSCPDCHSRAVDKSAWNAKHGTLHLFCPMCGFDGRVELEGHGAPRAEAVP